MNCYPKLEKEISVALLGFELFSSENSVSWKPHFGEGDLAMVTRPQCGIYYSVCVDSMSLMNGQTLSEESHRFGEKMTCEALFFLLSSYGSVNAAKQNWLP